ncbi:MAG: hypothetical protein QOF00_856 [Pseudonocardiales bacterium]|jgi:hypothetical protein|nr:hypothetical protein [Pseudonocardiales bacterium]
MPPRTRTASDRSDVASPAHDEATAGRRSPVEAGVDASGDPHGVAVGGGIRLPLPPGLPDVDAKRLLWWGGLGVAAVVGLLEWPVALAVGVGSVVAERLARERAAQPPAPGPRIPE